MYANPSTPMPEHLIACQGDQCDILPSMNAIQFVACLVRGNFVRANRELPPPPPIGASVSILYRYISILYLYVCILYLYSRSLLPEFLENIGASGIVCPPCALNRTAPGRFWASNGRLAPARKIMVPSASAKTVAVLTYAPFHTILNEQR